MTDSTCGALDHDDTVPPPWNGPAAAGALRWAAREGVPLVHRLILVSLALIADDGDGLIGAVSNLELANLTGAPLNDVEPARHFLLRRGALVEMLRPGQAPALFIGPTVLDAIPSCALLDAANARPAPPRLRKYVYRKTLAPGAFPTGGNAPHRKDH